MEENLYYLWSINFVSWTAMELKYEPLKFRNWTISKTIYLII